MRDGSEPIAPTYRRNFILWACGGLFLVTLAAGLALYAALDRPYGGQYLRAVATLDRLQAQVPAIVVGTVLAQVLLLAALVFAGALVWTHKIAGPLFFLRHTFRRLAAGDLSPVRGLRRGDQLQEVPEQLNRFLDRQRQRAGRLQGELEGVAGELAAARERPEALTAESLEGWAARLAAAAGDDDA